MLEESVLVLLLVTVPVLLLLVCCRVMVSLSVETSL